MTKGEHKIFIQLLTKRENRKTRGTCMEKCKKSSKVSNMSFG